MLSVTSWRPAALLVLVAGLMAGCSPYGYGVHRPAERVVVRTPPPPPRSAPLYNRADRDARAYVHHVHRAVRLSPAQQREIHDRLAHRTFHLLDRSHPRDHRYLYPFPRQAGERDRDVQRFWRDADRDIERTMSRQQRRIYRDYVRYHFSARAAHPGRHPHGGPPGRRGRR